MELHPKFRLLLPQAKPLHSGWPFDGMEGVLGLLPITKSLAGIVITSPNPPSEPAVVVLLASIACCPTFSYSHCGDVGVSIFHAI
jgi:hypothetical protein